MLGINVIEDDAIRTLWYNSYEKKGLPGHYAYGAKKLKCIKTPRGYRIKDIYLPPNVPIYKYGHPTSEPFKHRHGPYVFKCQLPGVVLPSHTSIEEKLFKNTDTTLRRSRKNMLKVRCGKFYRIVLLNLNINTPFCYIFGTNIRVPSEQIPMWMRREHITLPHPARTSRDEIKSCGGKVYLTGRPQVGVVYIAGIKMRCTAIRQLCTILFQGKKFYAHASVTLTYKQHASFTK